MQGPSEDVFSMTASIFDAPNDSQDIEIILNGFPIGIGDELLTPLEIIKTLMILLASMVLAG